MANNKSQKAIIKCDICKVQVGTIDPETYVGASELYGGLSIICKKCKKDTEKLFKKMGLYINENVLI